MPPCVWKERRRKKREKGDSKKGRKRAPPLVAAEGRGKSRRFPVVKVLSEREEVGKGLCALFPLHDT